MIFSLSLIFFSNLLSRFSFYFFPSCLHILNYLCSLYLSLLILFNLTFFSLFLSISYLSPFSLFFFHLHILFLTPLLLSFFTYRLSLDHLEFKYILPFSIFYMYCFLLWLYILSLPPSLPISICCSISFPLLSLSATPHFSSSSSLPPPSPPFPLFIYLSSSLSLVSFSWKWNLPAYTKEIVNHAAGDRIHS